MSSLIILVPSLLSACSDLLSQFLLFYLPCSDLFSYPSSFSSIRPAPICYNILVSSSICPAPICSNILVSSSICPAPICSNILVSSSICPAPICFLNLVPSLLSALLQSVLISWFLLFYSPCSNLFSYPGFFFYLFCSNLF